MDNSILKQILINVGTVIVLAPLLLIPSIFILYAKLQDERNYRKYLLKKQNPYKKKNRFMSPNEVKVYEVLTNLPSLKNFIVYAQVPYSAIIEVEPDFRDLGGRFEAINKYRADYLAVNKANYEPILIIELNDSTHLWKNRKSRDITVESALESCKIPYLNIEIKDILKPVKLNELIQSYLESAPKKEDKI